MMEDSSGVALHGRTIQIVRRTGVRLIEIRGLPGGNWKYLAVPEPGTYAMLFAGLGVLVLAKRVVKSVIHMLRGGLYEFATCIVRRIADALFQRSVRVDRRALCCLKQKPIRLPGRTLRALAGRCCPR